MPVAFSGKAATTTLSGLTSGSEPLRATPGMSSMTCIWSVLTALSISEVAPARRMMALLGDPDDTSVALNPLASASMATNTPTVPVMPSTATTVEVQRTRKLRML